MTGIDRPNSSYRGLFLLFILLGMPIPSRSGTLEDSAKELARRIVASLPDRSGVSVETRNLSTLTAGEVANVKGTLDAELRNLDVRISSTPISNVDVLVTFSENVQGYEWSAEIRQGNVSRVVFLSVRKSQENQTPPRAKSLSLHAEKLWEGPEPILDAADVGIVDLVRRLVLLVPEGVLVRKFEDGSTIMIPIDSNQTRTRNPEGTILHLYPLTVLLEPNICTVVLNPPSLQECLPSPKVSVVPTIPGHGQVTEIRTSCGVGFQTLASGAGDYSQPDTVQAFELLDGAFVPVSQELTFPGPVSLHNAATRSEPVTAVVRNLRTGNYEAFELSISCQR